MSDHIVEAAPDALKAERAKGFLRGIAHAAKTRRADEERREFDASIAITVMGWDLDEAARDALFERIADAAHELGESVSCSASMAAAAEGTN